jgi:predicted nucleic acid-binding protein
VIVVDASALLEVLLRTPAAPSIETRLQAAAESLHAPHLIDVEVAQVLRRYARRGDIADAHGDQVLAFLAEFPLRRYPHTPLLPRMWELRNNFSSYDAAYIALAEALDASLLTHDGRLARAAGHAARVELV